MNKYIKICIIFGFLLTLVGCSSSNTLDNFDYNEQGKKQVIQINEDLRYVSIGRDNDGCMMYQAQSDTMATMQAIVYQNSPGKFSLSKDKSSCL